MKHRWVVAAFTLAAVEDTGAIAGQRGFHVTLEAPVADIRIEEASPNPDPRVIVSAEGRLTRIYVQSGEVAFVQGFDGSGAPLFRFEGIDGRNAVLGGEAFLRLSHDTLMMLDPRREELLVFAAKPMGASIARRIAIHRQVDDVCLAGRMLYLHSSASGPTVYALDLNGNVLRSFPVRTREYVPLILATTYQAKLICDDKRIIIASELRGILQAYSLSGMVLWERAVPGFKLIQINQSGGLSATLLSPRGGYHRVETLFSLNDSVVTVQLSINGPRGRSRDNTVDTRYFTARNGRPLGSERLPMVYGASSTTMVTGPSAFNGVLKVHSFSTIHD